ncbi:MAG: M67 family peptidase [Candidatus Abyssobacteria bacterium SURF_17]|jgi:proteasome lid subunit RPN8/RPN11|uniref:M67 family peptidase n=1 Tax=Candidatus Abyssobacteria bacterium SURF_17 TaxID=2093361 RepID=A0A419F9B9_9BACT|nr:MAG: M67 family peptidase [Candidatus Abyssubacteria bacterium SURF_17]
MLNIPKRVLDDIYEHARETYPEECCGILVGRDAGKDRFITESHRAENMSKERRHERYLVDERKLIEVIKSVRGSQVDVVGFYHSHPDYPSRPSGFDTESAAWPGYSYLIVSVEADKVVSAQSWQMPDGAESFVEEPMTTDEERRKHE